MVGAEVKNTYLLKTETRCLNYLDTIT